MALKIYPKVFTEFAPFVIQAKDQINLQVNFFIPKFHNHKKKHTQNAYKRTKTKNVYKKHLSSNINEIIEIIVVQ